MLRIPKIIHFCWFGPNPIPTHLREYIDEWKVMLPDYEFMFWSDASIPRFNNAFVEGAIANNKWAFVSDVARFHFLFEYGGIYFDTDIKLLKPLPTDLLEAEFYSYQNDEILGWGVFGAPKKSLIIKEILELYDKHEFLLDNIDNLIITELISNLPVYQRILKSTKVLDYSIFYSYPFHDVFSGRSPQEYIGTNSIGLHMWDRSWWGKSKRGEEGALFNLYWLLWQNRYQEGWQVWLKYVLAHPKPNVDFVKNTLYHLKRQLLSKVKLG